MHNGLAQLFYFYLGIVWSWRTFPCAFILCFKQVAGLASSDSTTTQVTVTGNNHPEAFIHDGVDAIEAVDDVDDVNAVEAFEDLSDDKDNYMTD